MKKMLEFRAYILKFYAIYSRYINILLRFLLAFLTFSFISNQVGYMELLSNPAVTIGLSVICVFLPMNMTVIFAALIVLIQFLTLALGAAIVAAVLMLIMFALYFRYASEKSVVLLLTPIAFTLHIPILIPIVFGMIAGPICAIPIAFGVMIYYMITYVKSYAAVIETVAEMGVMEQISTFAQELFSDKEMWMIIISFTICLLLVYNVRCLAIDYAHEIAIEAGVLAHLIMMTFGFVIMDVIVSYVELIISSVIAVVLAIFLKIFMISVDYTRSEYLQFEDDEYYYYVKAIPKMSVGAPDVNVKRINYQDDEAEADEDFEYV